MIQSSNRKRTAATAKWTIFGLMVWKLMKSAAYISKNVAMRGRPNGLLVSEPIAPIDNVKPINAM